MGGCRPANLPTAGLAVVPDVTYCQRDGAGELVEIHDSRGEVGAIEVEYFGLQLHAVGVAPIGDSDDDRLVVAGDLDGLRRFRQLHYRPSQVWFTSKRCWVRLRPGPGIVTINRSYRKRRCRCRIGRENKRYLSLVVGSAAAAIRTTGNGVCLNRMNTERGSQHHG